MYTENKSIDGLTAITPTIDDLVVTMDQAEVGVAKSSTLLSVYNLFKTTYDTVYAKYLGDADFYKYSIVTSVASGNLTVDLKNYEGNDPTPTKPVKIQIGGVIRTITSALSLTINAGTNWFNLGSNELATKEVDIFSYLMWNTGTNAVSLGLSRIPYGIVRSDFNVATESNEKFYVFTDGGGASTDKVVNIGRFNAILSAGAGYTWSVPATSVIINSPIYETRWLDWTPTLTWSGTAPTSPGTLYAKYKIIGDTTFVKSTLIYGTDGNNNTSLNITTPFSTSNDGYVNKLINGGFNNNYDTPISCKTFMNRTASNVINSYGSSTNANNFVIEGNYNI